MYNMSFNNPTQNSALLDALNPNKSGIGEKTSNFV